MLKLRRSVKDARDKLTTTDTQHINRERNANSITLTAIVVSLVFIVLTSPLAFYNLLSLVASNIKKADDINFSFRIFIRQVVYIIAYFNYSVNFYLYCLTGERLRREFRAIMCGCVVQS